MNLAEKDGSLNVIVDIFFHLRTYPLDRSLLLTSWPVRTDQLTSRGPPHIVRPWPGGPQIAWWVYNVGYYEVTEDFSDMLPGGLAVYLWIVSMLSMSGVTLRCAVSDNRAWCPLCDCIVWYLKLIKQCHKGEREREATLLSLDQSKEDGDKVNKGFPQPISILRPSVWSIKDLLNIHLTDWMSISMTLSFFLLLFYFSSWIV